MVPSDEHLRWVEEIGRDLLLAVASRSLPTSEHIERAGQVGRVRARQGLDIGLLLATYQQTYRQIWTDLSGRASAEDAGSAADLLHVVDLAWTWLQVLSGAASGTHAEERRRLEILRTGNRQGFFASLVTDGPGDGRTLRLGSSVGFRPGGAFRAFAMSREDWPEDCVVDLQIDLERMAGEQHCATNGSRVLVLSQIRDPDPVLAVIREHGTPGTPIGVGLRRHGLEGAALSISDAEASLEWASAEQARTEDAAGFEEDWLAVSLYRSAERLRPLLNRAAATARTDPHLAQAVEAFAGGDLLIATAARTLQIQPNSLAYRLNRWRDLTGLDPRTGDGLVASMVALRIYRGEETDATG